MSKHYHECCYPMTGYGGGYPAGFGGGYGAAAYSGAGCYGAGGGLRWIYALLILIVIVLQFGAGRKEECAEKATDGCCGGEGLVTGRKKENQLIDNSVLFIIIVFLLTLCAGCWGGGCGSGYGGYGY